LGEIEAIYRNKIRTPPTIIIKKMNGYQGEFDMEIEHAEVIIAVIRRVRPMDSGCFIVIINIEVTMIIVFII
jgi:hypothetical protein